MVTRQTILSGVGGSNPTSPHHFKIHKGSFSDFRQLLKNYHYKGDKIGGSISHNLVLKYGSRVVGGAVLGRMRHDKKYEKESLEIRRMVLDVVCPKNTASYFLSKIVWWVKKNTKTKELYSFADLSAGHVGTSYIAANFFEVKRTKTSVYVLWNGKRYHPRSLTINRPYSFLLRNALIEGEARMIKGPGKTLFKYVVRGDDK